MPKGGIHAWPDQLPVLLESGRSRPQACSHNFRRCGDFRQEKGPGEHPGPCDWWWGGTPHQTTVESTESKRCGLLLTRANRIEKPAGVPFGTGRSNRFFALIGHRKGPSTSFAFWASSIPEAGIEPASVATTNNTPIYTRSWGKAIRHAANGAYIHRIRCGD